MDGEAGDDQDPAPDADRRSDPGPAHGSAIRLSDQSQLLKQPKGDSWWHQAAAKDPVVDSCGSRRRPQYHGGDGWESNPPRTPQQRPANGFEDRGRHQPPNIPNGDMLAARFRVLLSAHDFDADERLAALHPRVMARRDGVRLARTDAFLGAVLHPDFYASRHGIAHMRVLARIGSRHRLDALGPAPTRLEVEPTDREAFQPYDLDTRLVRA